MELHAFIQTEPNITHGENMTQQDSGFTMNYTDPFSGLNLPEAWIQIITINYVPYDHVLIAYDIYENQASYNQKMSPVFSNNQLKINVDSDNWNLYFDPSVMDLAAHNIQKQGLDFLQSDL